MPCAGLSASIWCRPVCTILKERYPRQVYSLYLNGIDDDFLGKSFDTTAKHELPKTLLYAGNIGEGQGLHHIVAQLATILGSGWRIKVIGSGGALHKLRQSIAKCRRT